MIEGIEDSIRELGEKPIRRRRAKTKPVAGCSTTSMWWCTSSEKKSGPYSDQPGASLATTRRASIGRSPTRRPPGKLGPPRPHSSAGRALAGSQEVRGSNPRGSTNAGQTVYGEKSRATSPRKGHETASAAHTSSLAPGAPKTTLSVALRAKNTPSGTEPANLPLLAGLMALIEHPTTPQALGSGTQSHRGPRPRSREGNDGHDLERAADPT